MAAGWQTEWRGLNLRVEQRRVGDDEGGALCIGSSGGQEPWLRFDCFEGNPHWHVDPAGQDERHALDERGDPIQQTFDLIRRELPALLSRAGAAESICAAAEGLSEGSGLALLRDAERAMRHQPTALEELDIGSLRARRSEKWHSYPPDVLPAWVAEMDFPIAAPIRSELRRFTEQSDLGYPIALRETGLAEIFSERMQERFDWHPDPSRVEILSEVVQGMYLALEAFSRPGEGVIVQTPIYPPFLHSVRDTGRLCIENPLVAHEARLEIDFDGLARGLTDSTRVFLFCNPHNPSGRVFSRPELERLAETVVARDLIIVSDEIHGDLLFDERRHIPFASLSPEVAERTVTLSSPSKAFNIPGLRCAVAHFGSKALQDRFNGVVQRHVRGGIGLLGLYASMAAWRWAQPWLDEVVPYLEANRDFAEAALRERIPEIRFFRPEATYLAWLECSGLAIQGSPAAHFLRHGRVALSDGKVFGPGWEQHVRLNFATSRPILTEVIERMAKALGR